MPRNGSNVYSKPSGTTAVANTTIESAKFNTLVDDIIADLNAARPISAGGTGATSASAARTNLDVYSTSGADTAISTAITTHSGSGDHDARYARLNAAVDFSEVTIDANTPSLFLNEADQAADSRLKSVGLSNGNWVFTDRSDAGVATSTRGTLEPAGPSTSSASAILTKEKGEALFHPLNSVIGVGQTWQNVTASRTFNTSYQNTTGKPIQVQVTVAAGGTGDQFEVSTNNSTWVPVASFNTSSGIMTSSVIVPDDHYYRSSGSLTILYWSELR